MSRFRTRLTRLEKAVPEREETITITVRDPDDPMPPRSKRLPKEAYAHISHIEVIDPPGWGETEFQPRPETDEER